MSDRVPRGGASPGSSFQPSSSSRHSSRAVSDHRPSPGGASSSTAASVAGSYPAKKYYSNYRMPGATRPSVGNGGGGGSYHPSPSSPPHQVLGRCPVGSIIRCVLNHHDRRGGVTYEGQVLAYEPDPKSHILIIKCPGKDGRQMLSNVHLINLAADHEIRVIKECKEPVPHLPSLNTNRLQNRQREQLDRKKKWLMAFKANVSPEGRKLFQAIGKTIDELTWLDDKIVVMNKVTISPPYTPEDVHGDDAESKALKHVRKIVEKHIADEQSLQAMASSSTETSSRTSPVGAVENSSPGGLSNNSQPEVGLASFKGGGSKQRSGTGRSPYPQDSRRTPPHHSSKSSHVGSNH